MRYFVIESTFHQPASVSEQELRRLVKEHQACFARGFAEGWILASGPKVASGGGAIVLNMSSIEEVEAYLAGDPLKVAGVQDYRVVEFRLHDCQPEVREWFR